MMGNVAEEKATAKDVMFPHVRSLLCRAINLWKYYKFKVFRSLRDGEKIKIWALPCQHWVLPWPGLEPGLLRPQRRVLTTAIELEWRYPYIFWNIISESEVISNNQLERIKWIACKPWLTFRRSCRHGNIRSKMPMTSARSVFLLSSSMTSA